MPLSKKVLEDSVRLARIRRIKMTLYIVQVAMLVALAFFLIFVIGDAALTPSLYLPVDQFAAVMVLLLLVVCVESFFFRMMEIRFARSSSARHLMAKNSINRSIIIAIISAIVTIVLMVQPILAVAEDASMRTVTISSSEDFSFWSRDPLALQRVSELRMSSAQTLEIYLVEDAVYEEYEGNVGDMFFMRLNRDDYELDGALDIPVPVLEHTLLHVVVNDLSSPGASVNMDVVKDTSETITGIVSILSLAFVVTNIAWIAYLVPIERKYSQGSIYK
jgi:hypothetical protein